MQGKREDKTRGQHIDSLAVVALRLSKEWIKTDIKSNKLLRTVGH